MTNSMITLTVNGKEHSLSVDPTRRLFDVLSDDLGLRSVRCGCGIGKCGTCTVLIDEKAVSSCLILAGQAEGSQITTVEGLAQDGRLHPVQEAFIEQRGFQCAYCTPGFILSTVALLKEQPDPDPAAIKAYLAGNICRCGSYLNILEAVIASSSKLGP